MKKILALILFSVLLIAAESDTKIKKQVKNRIVPKVLLVNINAKNGAILKGRAIKDTEILVEFVNKNKKILLNSKANKNDIWTIDSKQVKLKDGKYKIIVYIKNNGKKVEIYQKTHLRDTTINAIVKIFDNIKNQDKIINKSELSSWYIEGKIDLDSKITNLYLIDKNKTKLKIDFKNIKLDKKGKFKILGKNINLEKLSDGKIKVVLEVKDKFNSLKVKSSILKDTIPPKIPNILKIIKEHNLMYAKNPNQIVFSGAGEAGATIKVVLDKQIIINSNVLTNKKWIIYGKDIPLNKIKSGNIEVKIYQIDKAKNISKPLALTLKKQNLTIDYVNIDAVEGEVLAKGGADKNISLKVALVYNKNERISVEVRSDENGSWVLNKDDISKHLEDGIYDIYAYILDENGTKKQLSSIKGLIRDKTITASVKLHDNIEKQSDNIINKEELKIWFITGRIDKDSKIVDFYIYNEKDKNESVKIDTAKVKISKDGNFSVLGKDINLTNIKDGILIVKMKAKDEHNNTIVVEDKISKDTTPPQPPLITQIVKDNNMIYATVSNKVVFSGEGEVDAKVEVKIFNIKYPKDITLGSTTVPFSSKWTLAGRDFSISSIKDGIIKSIITLIDKAGNRSESIFIYSKKELPPIFPKKVVPIAPQDYMPIYKINVGDQVKAIKVNKDYIIAGTYEFINYYDKIHAKLQKSIEIKHRWINSLLIYEGRLIIGLDNGEIQFRDINSTKLIKTLENGNKEILDLLLDKKDNRLVVSFIDGSIAIWDLKNYKKLYDLRKHQWDVRALAISGNRLFTGSDDYTLKMWDIRNGKLLKSLKNAHDGSINCLIIYKNMLISAGDDGYIFVRDIASGKLLHILKGHKKGVTKLKINRDILVSASKDRTLILWNLHTFNKIKQLRGHSKAILSIDINDENIVTGAMDYKIRIWGYNEALQNQGEIDETKLAKYDLIKSMDLSNDTITDISQTENEIVFSTKGYIFFYNNVTYKFSRSYSTLDKVFAQKNKKDSIKDKENNDEWGDAEETDDEEAKNDEDSDWENASDEEDEEQPIWQVKIDKIKAQREKEAQTSLQWIYDIDLQGNILIAGLGYKNIKIWDLERNKAIKLLEGHDNAILSIARTEGNIVTASRDGTIKVWDDENYNQVLSIDASQTDIRCVLVDDGKIYSAGDDYNIKVWDFESGDLIKVIKNAHFGTITKLYILNDLLISSSLDGTIKFRDKESGKLLYTIDAKSPINSFAIDEENIMGALEDGSIKVWDLKTKKLIHTLKGGHKAGVSAIMISDDYIISGGKDKKICIWKYYE